MRLNQWWQKEFYCYKHIPSLDINTARILLFLGSVVAHNHRNSQESIWIIASSTKNSDIFLLLLDDSFTGLSVWIHFQIDTWLLLLTMNRKYNALLAIFLVVDKPTKKIQIQPIVNISWRCSVSSNHKEN